MSRKNLLTDLYHHLFLPPSNSMNFDIATAIALDLSVNVPFKNNKAFQKIYGESVAFIEPLINQASSLSFKSKNHVILLDRQEWIINTLSNISVIFNNLFSDISPLRQKEKGTLFFSKTTEIISTAELGLLTAFLSQKVLGQYDINIFSKESDNLLFVIESNILEKENEMMLKDVPFRFWILAHELTHKLQFENFSWIKSYYHDLILKLKQITKHHLKHNKTTRLPALSLLLNKEIFQLVSEIQTFMSFIEGYADFIMFKVGEKLPGYEKLVPVFKRQKQNNPFIKKLTEKILGFEAKANQYKKGLFFVEQIANQKGLPFLNKNMDSPAKIPTAKELAEPKLWIKRVR